MSRTCLVIELFGIIVSDTLLARPSSLRGCLSVSQAYSLLGVLTLEVQVEAVKKFGHSIGLRMRTTAMKVIDDDS